MSKLVREGQEIIERILRVFIYFTSLTTIYMTAVSPDELFVDRTTKISIANIINNYPFATPTLPA
jgi:hypothetical protein